MKKITLPQFQKALSGVWPASYKMVLAWAETDYLPCFRNPRAPKDQAHYCVKPYCIAKFCKEALYMSPAETEAVLQALGLDKEIQSRLF